VALSKKEKELILSEGVTQNIVIQSGSQRPLSFAEGFFRLGAARAGSRERTNEKTRAPSARWGR